MITLSVTVSALPWPSPLAAVLPSEPLVVFELPDAEELPEVPLLFCEEPLVVFELPDAEELPEVPELFCEPLVVFELPEEEELPEVPVLFCEELFHC